TAIKKARNKLAIPETEVEQKAREHAIFTGEETSTSALLTRIKELEKAVSALQEKLSNIENLPAQKPVEASVSPPASKQPANVRSGSTTLPHDAMLARDFARNYGVNPRTFLDQCK